MANFLNSLASFPRTILRRLLFLLETPFVYLFGRDIFISYARADAANYAQQLGIAVRAEVPQLSFFLDQWASLSGETLPLSLRLALRWSQLLVFVGTQNAIDSAHVRMELQAFFNRKGRFVPIDVGGVLDQAILKDKFLSAVCGPGAVPEKSEDVAAGIPSKTVVTRIVNAVTFTRQDRRLRRAVVGTTLGVFAIIAAAYFVSQSIVSAAESAAEVAYLQADTAKQQQAKALLDMGEATLAASNANADQIIARLMAKQANEDARLAKNARIGAERLRDQARAEATRQSEIAISRQRANQSELTLRQSPTLLADSASLAIESMERAHAIGTYSLEADRALRASLSLMPRSLGPPIAIKGLITATALSSDGQHIAVLSRNNASEKTSTLRVISGEEREIASFPQDFRIVALSNDARRVSISNGRTVQTRDISGAGRWELKIENEDDWVTKAALSPDGKYLALIMRNADSEEGRGFAEVWEVESGKRVTRLLTGALTINSIAFSANGRLLTIGGVGNGPTGKAVGRALVWSLRSYGADRALHENDFRQRNELLQNDFIDAVAAGRDERFLATANDRMAVVWKRSNRGDYQQIARMPLVTRIDKLAFNPDGNHLHVLSIGACDTTVECRRRYFETWEATGYWQTSVAPHTEMIESLAFQPGDELITTITSGYGDDNVRIWRASDGQEMKDANVRFDDDNNVRGKTVTPDVRFAVSASEGAWYVWDVVSRTKTPISTAGLEVDTLQDASLTPDGNLFAFAGKKNGESKFSAFIYKREGSSFVMAHTLPLLKHPTALSISPDKNRIGVLYSDHGLKVLDIQDGRDRTPPDVAFLKEKVQSFEFAPDGKSLAALFDGDDETGQSVSVWRLSDGRAIEELVSTGQIEHYSFSSRGEYLAATMKQNTVEVLNIREDKTTVLHMGGRVNLVAFSPDSRLLAIADVNGLVTVINLESKDEVAHLQHDDRVYKIVFSKDGKYLASATKADNEDQSPRNETYLLNVWLLRPSDLIKEACQRLTRFRVTQLSYCASR